MGARLSEDELQRALDFCVHLFSPTTPEQHDSVRKKLQALGLTTDYDDSTATRHGNPKGSDAMDVRAPVISPAKLDQLARRYASPSTTAAAKADNLEVKMVLEKVNARRVIHAEHGNGLNSLEEEAVEGFVVRLQAGQLGLVKNV